MNSFTKSLLIFVIICYFCQMIIDSKESVENRTRTTFSYTKEELELTKANPIIDNKPCSGHTLAVFIHSAGYSSGKYFDRRQALRKTWIKELKEYKIKIYFIISLNSNQTVNEELREESDTYKDMIQFSFIDDYYNLTLKAISILRWINSKCLSVKFILKSDDDIVINSALLIDKLSEFKRGISGVLHQNALVSRNISGLKFFK